MGDPERPGPPRDGETKRYSIRDELEASQLPGHNLDKDAGIYPREIVDRMRAEAAADAARDDVQRLARPAYTEHPVGVHPVIQAQSPWEVESDAHERRMAARTKDYLEKGPGILRPLRQLRLWTRNGIPPKD